MTTGSEGGVASSSSQEKLPVVMATDEKTSLFHYAVLDTLVTVVDALNVYDVLGSIETLADANNISGMIGNTGSKEEQTIQNLDEKQKKAVYDYAFSLGVGRLRKELEKRSKSSK